MIGRSDNIWKRTSTALSKRFVNNKVARQHLVERGNTLGFQ